MVKRRSVEDGGEDRGVVIAEVQQLITGGNAQMQLIGCSIITALMQEYATTVKSSDVGLPWEVHFKAKKQFESTDLQNIFRFSVGALRELAANLVLPLSEEMRNLVRRLTVISETVLSWTFINVNLPKKLISVFESDQNPSLRPGAAWKEVGNKSISGLNNTTSCHFRSCMTRAWSASSSPSTGASGRTTSSPTTPSTASSSSPV